jgi:hypothetical protein
MNALYTPIDSYTVSQVDANDSLLLIADASGSLSVYVKHVVTTEAVPAGTLQ